MSAGSFAIVSGSGQSMPTTSSAILDIGSITIDADDILTETSSGVYRPDSEGYYLIVAEGLFTVTHNNRYNGVFELRKNSTVISGACGSGYARNSANNKAWMRAQAILPFNGTTDTFDIQHYRDTGDGTPAGSYTWTRVKVIQLTNGTSSVAYGRYGTPTSGAYGGEGLSAIPGWDVESETDTDIIELQSGTADSIRLKKKDQPYLIVYGLKNSDSGATYRTMRCSDLEVGGTKINHSFGSSFQRNNHTQYAFPTGMGLVRPSSDDQDMKIRCCGYIDNKATLWGSFSNQNWTLSSGANASGVMVIALPSTTKMAVFKDDTAGQSVLGSTVDLNAVRTTVGTADSPFVRDNNIDVSLSSATDVLAYGCFHEERTSSSSTRWTGQAIWEKEGVNQTDTPFGNYERGDESSYDCKNAAASALFLGEASNGDTFQLEYQNQGDNGGHNATSWAGSFFLDLDSLANAENMVLYKPTGFVGVINSAGFTITCNLVKDE